MIPGTSEETFYCFTALLPTGPSGVWQTFLRWQIRRVEYNPVESPVYLFE